MDLIGLNDPLYQGVANHVSRAKVRKRDTLDGTQHPDGMPQPGLGFTWEVNLRHITRDNDGGPKPIRVRNIFICSAVVFWLSSRMINASFKVRPRM